FAPPHPAAGVLASIIKSFEDAPALVAATLILSASTDGKDEVGDLIQQSADILNGRLDLEEDEMQTAFNLGLDPAVRELTATIAAHVDTLHGRAAPLRLHGPRAP